MTYITSVKNIIPDVGCILISLRELNCLPKKLSSKTVALYGGLGLTKAIEGGREPLPEVMRSKEERYGPVPPLVIWIVSGRLSCGIVHEHGTIVWIRCDVSIKKSNDQGSKIAWESRGLTDPHEIKCKSGDAPSSLAHWRWRQHHLSQLSP